MKIRYYQASGGRSPVEDFLLGLPEAARLEVADALLLLESGQMLEMPLSRNLGAINPGLHELRFRKKTQTIPRRELEIIHKRLKEI